MIDRNYDIIVVGAGHAGIESALASARLGKKTLLITLEKDGIALMPCNPSIGGTAKGHLVREIDALGGQMALSADKALLQIKMLNRGKGPAVYSLRGQADKKRYHDIMVDVLENQQNLTLLYDEASDLIVENGKISKVATQNNGEFSCICAILATGVYLNGKTIIGPESKCSGPYGFVASTHLTASLLKLGFDIRRFKTGTPARIEKDSIDYDKMAVQEGEYDIDLFSFMSDGRLEKQMPCWLTYTNEETHDIIRKNIDRSPLYNGSIFGIGPRYCPSIEDKVMRFQDKTRHQIFVEPEGEDSNMMYIQGMSSSLPKDVQEDMYHSVKGLERCVFIRHAYAIEYDCLNPEELLPNLELKKVKNLFAAGQINGSSGYEEAAAQGLMAGINAVLTADNKPPFILGRDEAYIGVLIDDLVTKGTNEPYRMMTARAEYRLKLRQDNADLRLTEKGYELGLCSKERLLRMHKRRDEINTILSLANSVKFPKKFGYIFERHGEANPEKSMTIKEALKHPAVTFDELSEVTDIFKDFSQSAIYSAEVMIKYEGYLNKEESAIRDMKRLEERTIPQDIDYLKIDGLRLEARQKLNKIRPLTVGQAGRISGVSPADITVLLITLRN